MKHAYFIFGMLHCNFVFSTLQKFLYYLMQKYNFSLNKLVKIKINNYLSRQF